MDSVKRFCPLVFFFSSSSQITQFFYSSFVCQVIYNFVASDGNSCESNSPVAITPQSLWPCMVRLSGDYDTSESLTMVRLSGEDDTSESLTMVRLSGDDDTFESLTMVKLTSESLTMMWARVFGINDFNSVNSETQSWGTEVENIWVWKSCDTVLLCRNKPARRTVYWLEFRTNNYIESVVFLLLPGVLATCSHLLTIYECQESGLPLRLYSQAQSQVIVILGNEKMPSIVRIVEKYFQTIPLEALFCWCALPIETECWTDAETIFVNVYRVWGIDSSSLCGLAGR